MGKERGSKDRAALVKPTRAVRSNKGGKNKGGKDDDRLVNLWCAVLSKAISDGLISIPGEVGCNKSITTTAINETISCRKWILEMRLDFCMVCDLAQYNPRAVKDHFERLLDKKEQLLLKLF